MARFQVSKKLKFLTVRAAIDIGTNTVLLLVAESDGRIVMPLLEKQEIPRLGRQVDEARNLSGESIRKVETILRNYRNIITSNFGDIPVIVTATSAVRDATNRDHFLDYIKINTGFNVRILSGDDEAEWTYFGALAPLVLPADQQVLVVDIGGGSTELAAGRRDQLQQYLSMDMGSVRYTERYLKHGPPALRNITACREEIRVCLENSGLKKDPGTVLTGVAGTVTTLAALCHNLADFEAVRPTGMKITSEQLKQIITEIKPLRSGEILAMNPGVLKGREDVILAGLLILEGVMDHFAFSECIVSTGGIRHGALLRAFDR
jgi:exopolyphosphatase / guanosine-5'-triphosphate,3'-diphosphate pyrophosphatase